MKPPHRSLSTYLLGLFFLLSTTFLLIHYTAQPNYTSCVPTFIRPTPPSTLEVDSDSPRRLPREYKPYYPTLTLPDELSVYPELYKRLHAFLTRPVRGYWEALEGNEKRCPRNVSDELVNPDQLNGDGEFWRNSVDEEKVRKERVGLVDYLAGLVRVGHGVVWEEEELTRDELDAIEEGEGDEVEVEVELPGVDVRKEKAGRRSIAVERTGRGIVTTGGNADTLARLITLLQILREEYHSTLPIEIWTFPGEIDPDSSTASTLASLGATIQTVPPSYGLTKDPNLWKNFQIKGLALALSSFKELIYLDSDNIPLRDPGYLFDSTRYNAVGGGKAAFWPDLSRDHVDNAVWRVMGVECDLDDFTLESGQIVIDKAGNGGLNLAALHLAAYMQREKDFWFRMCGGDKDTFRWAFVALGIPFTRSPRWATCLGQMHSGRFCGHTVLQYELDPPLGEERERPLFVHSNLLKHISGVSQGDTFTHIKRMSLDEYHESTLNQAHMWVYWDNARGMCTDLEIRNEGKGLTREQKKTQTVLLEPVGEIEGNPLEGFEELFYRHGGRAGGW